MARRDDEKLTLTEAANALGLSRKTLSRSMAKDAMGLKGSVPNCVVWGDLLRAPAYTRSRLIQLLATRYGKDESELRRRLNSAEEAGRVRSVNGRYCWDDKERLGLELETGGPMKSSTGRSQSADAVLDIAFMKWLRGELTHPGELPEAYWDEPQPPVFIPPKGVFKYQILKEHRGHCKAIRSSGIRFDDADNVIAVPGALVEFPTAERANRHWERLESAWEACWEERWKARGAR